jgi:hypothetical protein
MNGTGLFAPLKRLLAPWPGMGEFAEAMTPPGGIGTAKSTAFCIFLIDGDATIPLRGETLSKRGVFGFEYGAGGDAVGGIIFGAN